MENFREVSSGLKYLEKGGAELFQLICGMATLQPTSFPADIMIVSFWLLADILGGALLCLLSGGKQTF